MVGTKTSNLNDVGYYEVKTLSDRFALGHVKFYGVSADAYGLYLGKARDHPRVIASTLSDRPAMIAIMACVSNGAI